MKYVKAFLGHSFLPADEVLVSAFTKHLNLLARLPIGFSWVHAEAAQARDLKDKVLPLFADSNIFIAICSKKERVVPADKVRRSWFSGRELVIKDEDAVWKTSDWIIQEIGLAVGHKMPIIILLENGVRIPGGLQGNIEHIPFDREFPDRAFDKITSMVNDLRDIESSALGTASEQPPELLEAPVGAAADEVRADEPDARWTYENYSMAFYRAVRDGQSAIEKKLDDTFQESRSGSDQQLAEWESLKQLVRAIFKTGSDVGVVRKLVERFPKNPTLRRNLASILSVFDLHREAADEYSAAAELHPEFHMIAGNYRLAAEEYGKAKLPVLEKAALQKIVQIARDVPTARAILIKALDDRSEDRNANELIGLMAAELRADPSNHELRFKIAYAYADQGRHEASLYHYSQIPDEIRSEASWNNIGVQYNILSMNSFAVVAFQKSIEMNGSLAASNLSNIMVEAGFLDKARETAGVFINREGVHPNLFKTMVNINEKAESDKKLFLDACNSAKRIDAFYAQFGAAITKYAPQEVGGVWLAPEWAMELTLLGEKITGMAHYEVADATNPLAGLGGLLQSPRAVRKMEVSLDLTINGKSAIGKYKQKRIDDGVKTIATMLYYDFEKDVIVFFNDEMNEMSVLDVSDKSGSAIFSIKKL